MKKFFEKELHTQNKWDLSQICKLASTLEKSTDVFWHNSR
jgi:hypothetical protein